MTRAATLTAMSLGLLASALGCGGRSALDVAGRAGGATADAHSKSVSVLLDACLP